MDFTPESNILLLSNVPLDNTYRDTLTFTDYSDQYSYFSSKVKSGLDYTGLTYQRTQKAVRALANAEQLWDVNYLMFQNINYGTKWFYAFVTDIQYVSPDTSYVYFEIDIMQTWMFERTIHPSFVLREHVNNDTIGENLVPENLQTGEPVVNNTVWADVGSDTMILFACSVDSSGEPATGNMYGNNYSGLSFFAFRSASGANNFMDVLLRAGKMDAIVSISMCPSLSITTSSNGAVVPSGGVNTKTVSAPARPVSFEGYVPKNNKLYTHPYVYLNLYATGEGVATFRYEKLGSYEFRIIGDISPSPSLFCWPTNYDGTTFTTSYGISLASYPNCPWTQQVYANYLNAHQTSTTLGILNSMISPAAMAFTNPVGALTGAISATEAMAKRGEDLLVPPQAKGNTGAANLLLAARQKDFLFQAMTIKRTFAEQIDNYFSMYGYQVNMLKIPNVFGRKEWNYVRTSNAMITGTAPFSSISRMRQILDNGITFWHNPNNVGNYGLDNSIVGGGANGTEIK